jgi:hypothetical protein
MLIEKADMCELLAVSSLICIKMPLKIEKNPEVYKMAFYRNPGELRDREPSFKEGFCSTYTQEQVPNHLRRLWSKAMVVSTGGKGMERTRSGGWQEEDRKGMSAPLFNGAILAGIKDCHYLHDYLPVIEEILVNPPAGEYLAYLKSKLIKHAAFVAPSVP